MTHFRSLHQYSTLGLFLVLLTGLGCGGSGIPTTRIEGKDFLVEFPNDPKFPVLTLHQGPVHGSVRVFGDGRVAVHKYDRGEGWQDFELRLLPAEMNEILEFMGEAGVFEFDSETVRTKLKEAGKSLPHSSHSSSATLEIRLAKYRGKYGRVAAGLSHRARIVNSGSILRRAAYYQEAPELVALGEVNGRLRDLSKRSDLKLTEVDHQELSAPPSWARAALSSGANPRILFFTSGPTEVWTMDWLGGDRQRLSTLEGARISYTQPPSVSPDRTAITYRKIGDGLQLVNLLTGETRKFIAGDKGSHSAVWSPGGDEVAVSAYIGDHRYNIFAVGSDGSTPRLLTHIGAKPLQWSNEGERLYYMVSNSEGRKIYVVNRDGTNTRPVLSLPGGAFQVSPDGRRAAFWTAHETGKSSSTWLWTTRLSRSQGTESRWRSPKIVAQDISGFDWSPDSQYFAFTSGRRLGVVRRGGRGSKILVHLEVGDRWPTQAKWSPDGDVVVFVKTPAQNSWGGGPEIWVIGRDGSDPRRLASGTFPHWVGETSGLRP